MMSSAEAAMLRLISASLAQQHEKTGQRRKFDRGRADQQFRQQQQQKRTDSTLNVIFYYT